MNYETTEQDTSCLPEPLTRKNADGEILQREPVVDMQIQEALRLAPKNLRRRSEIRDKGSPDFLKEESLVYLIRYYRRVGNESVANALSKSLLSRCSTWIYGRLYKLGADAAKEGHSEVVKQLFVQILDLGSDKGDFLQVCFWVVLKKRFTAPVFNNQLKQLKFGQNSIPLTSLEGYDSEDTNALVSPQSIELKVIEKDLIRAGLSQLRKPLRSAYLLRHYYGWQIENQDPNVQTISRRFNKTPRTIRNWLNKAEKCLEAWREENRDE